MNCKSCQATLPEGARFCPQCGAPQPQPQLQGPVEPLLDLSGDLPEQLNGLFMSTLKHKLLEEQPGTAFEDYAELLYSSGFRDRLAQKYAHLSESLRLLQDSGTPAQRLNHKIEREMDELTDQFVIHFARALNTINLPEAILRYQGPRSRTALPVGQAIFDYLHFSDQPKETVYTDFIQMPKTKLRNAGKSYLKTASRAERVLFICDQSLLGSCKEGFAMTEHGLYWKAQLQPPAHAHFAAAPTVAREKDWLLIDGHFFNANPTLNIRLMKLLRKLSTWLSTGA